MRRTFFYVLLIVGLLLFVLINNQKSVITNQEKAEKLIDDVFTCIALVEDDQGSREGETVYWCGARWTAGYGVTLDEKGKYFRKGDVVEKLRAKELSYKHLRDNVFPFLCHVKVPLKDREVVAVCLFIYNVGGEQFSGYYANGKKAKCPTSGFLNAINEGKSSEFIVNAMTGFRKSGGRRANGLLKRHWVTGAIYLGYLETRDVLKLRPKEFYNTKNFGNYYYLDERCNLVKKDGYYRLRYDDITLKAFVDMNTAKDGQKSVADII